MAKSSPRKSLKSLFSRSEANLAAPAPAAAEKEKDVDKTDGEKKKFKFPKLKKKSKTSSASEKTASENQQVSSAVELSSPAENGEAWADNIDSNKRFSLYATAPRSKKKELSYSELDLRKPKRFATFSFGLRKKKKKDEENISKSTFGIHSPGIEEQDETAQDFSQMELDQANAKMFSMSHPELDTSHTFDIPSPPPVATNQSDSYFTLLNQSESSVTGNTQTKAEEPLTNGSSLVVVHQDPGKAPIATIPELHLDDLDSSEEKAYNSYKIESDPSAPVTYRATTSAVDDQIVPNFPASQPPAELDTSDPKGGVFGSTSILQQSDTETDTADTESTGLTISNLEPDAPGTGFIITSNETLSLESVDSDIDGTNTESAHAPHNDVSAVSAAVADSIINGLGDNDILQQHNTEIETSVTKPTGAAILHHQLDAPVKADITTQNDDDEPSLGSVDSEIDATHAESALFPRSDNSALKTAVVDFTCNGPCDNHILKKSEIDTETLVTESTGAAISSHQLDAPGTADVTTQDNKPSLGSVDSGIDATNAESTTVPHIDNSALIKAVSDSTSDGLCDKYILEKSETETFISDCPTVTTLNHHPDAPDVTTQNDKPSLGDTAAVPNEVSISHTETSIPETTKTVTAASTDSSGKSSRPVNQEAVYGALYESLLPESFTSGVMSSLSKSPPQIHTEIRRLSAKSEPVMVKTFNECHTDTNLVYSRLPTSPGFDSAARRVNNAAGAYTNVNSVLSERKVISPRESSRYVYQASMTSGSHRDQDIYHRYLPSSPQTGSKPAYSNTIPYSELTHSHSEVKSGSFSDTVKSVPPIQSSAPPVSDYVTPHGTDTQITDSIRRVILVKESVTEEEGSTDTGRPSPVPEKMSAVRDLEIKTDTPALPARLDGLDGPLSPTYLSVGSDDGSAMEIYYSAEEDNIDSGEDETYSVAQREDVRVIDGVNKAVGLCEEMPEQGEVTGRWMSERDGGETRVVIVKVQNEGGKTGMEAKTDSLTGGQQQLRGQTLEARVQGTGMPEFLVGNDAKNQEKESANQVCLQVKQEGQEEREEELPATPVQQVNKLMVCDFAPPSSELRGQGEGSEGNWSKEWETKDHLDRELQLPGQEIEYLACKDISPQPMHATSIHTRETDMITPKVGSEASKESSETYSNTTTGPVQDSCGGVASVTGTLTRCAELQSDATGIEHNRVPESSEWVDTITQHTDRTWMIQQQVAVELSAQNKEARCPDTEAAVALSERHEHPAAEAHLEPNQGSVTASTTSSQVFAAENQPSEADQESADKMNLGYSSLSTKLTLSSSKEDDAKQRFRKVSLISEDDTSEVIQDTVGLSKITTVTEVNGADPDSEYRWKNRFEGVSPYKLYIAEDSSFSDSLSYRMSDSYSSSSSSLSSSALPEATAYKYVSHAFSSASSSSPEEHITLSNSLNDRAKVYLSSEGEPVAEWKDEWRRSLVKQEEPAVAAGERERLREVEAEGIKTRWDSQPLHVSSFSSTHQTSYDSTDSFKRDNDDDSRFTGVFQATRVELVPEPAAPPSTPPASPDTDSPSQFEMDSLVHTLKSMGPSLMPRGTGLRVPAPPTLISSLPPIVEDAPSSISTDIPDSVTSPTKKLEVTGNPAQALNGLHTTLPSVPPMPTLPPDLGLKRNITRDTRSPLELMKQSQQDGQQPGSRLLNSPLRGSATNSIVMRRSSDSSADDLPVLNGNGLLPSTGTGSRLDNSVIFGSLRSSSVDQPESRQAHRSLFRTSSLPDVDHVGIKDLDAGSGTDLATSRFERFSFLLNSSSSASGSLSGADDSNARMSRPPQLGISSPPSSSPTRLLSPTGSIDLQKPLFTPTESPLSLFSQTQGVGMGLGNGGLSTPILQRSFSSEGIAGVQQTSLFNSVQGGSQFQTQEPEKNLALKYRAFPDAYLTKEKEHGKLNPRPGKMYIFDRPGMCGQRIEVRSDVIDATPWELEETISIRVIRGGWVLYEKPNFKGEKIALDEGDIELTSPFSPLEEPQQNGQKEGEEKTGEQNGETSETKPAKKFIIGSIRRAVRDYSVPEISLFPEENAEGKKVIFRDTSEDARIFGFPIKANSIIINAGLWLVYAHPFFQGVPRVLEVGGYPNPAAWGVEKPYVGSVHPLKVGEPRVENTSEPKMIVYEKPYFSGKSRTITSNVRDFMTRMDLQQKAFMYNVGSLKVLGGIWVGYEKEGYRGHQYLLEEGEFHDWRVWGGRDAEMRSVRVIRADLTEPFMVMYEQPEEHHEEMQEENSFEVTEAIPDVELFEYKTLTRSIHVLSGAWIAYSHVDFSGNQYILEKGFYNNCADWGAEDNRICSVQPILLAPSETSRTRNEVVLYAEPDFQGECHIIDRNNEAVSEKLLAKSCRVSGGSWVIYEHKQFTGNLFVLSEGDYPNLMSMGCSAGFTIRSIKAVPTTFCVPSISLFGLECLEGREITTDTEILNMVEQGFNNHILSVRVNSGWWVICEHGNYRGRQFLLEPIEITNWQKFSSLQTVGSMYPIRQKRRFFRIKNTERGHFMSVQGGVEELKSGRVVVSPEAEPMSDIWYYQDGFIKSKLAQTMSLQVMGNIEPGAKAVLWTETRQPLQTWTTQMRGLITSLTFPGMVLDVKGGKTYDKDHVVIMPENDERPSQQWEIDLL